MVITREDNRASHNNKLKKLLIMVRIENMNKFVVCEINGSFDGRGGSRNLCRNGFLILWRFWEYSSVCSSCCLIYVD